MSTIEPYENQAAEPSPDGDGAQPGQLTRITRAMVAIYKEQFGRGPKHAHSHYAGPNAITCTLEGTLTPVERSLTGMGEDQRLRELRALFQHAAEPTFCAAVEEITGRKVIAFTSGMDTKVDLSTEHFVLEPEA
jgi:uncharacterized protein YbcI